MQTFLPYPDLDASAQVLDDKRLGKQRVETFQILRALTWPEYAWKNHPAVRMWRGFTPGLVAYGLATCTEWVRRGYADTVAEQLLGWTAGVPPVDPPLPPWFGHEPLHLSHRSSLVRKDPGHYRPLFGDVPDDLPYLWPADAFPRWPLRGSAGGRTVDAAAAELGLAGPHGWQRDAVAALAHGRDVLLVARPGTGGTTTGLLAALTLPGPGPALVVQPRWLPVAGPFPPLPLPPPRVVTGPGGAPAGPVGAPAGTPGTRTASPADLDAMAAEAEPADLVVAPADRLPTLPGARLLVVDGADRLDQDDATTARAAAPGAPVLLVVPRAPTSEQEGLAERFGLRGPVVVGGGWDPAGTRLEAVAASSRPADAVARALAGERSLVVVPDRRAADRLVVALRARGLRVAAWAADVRAGRAAEALASWRSRRLDALVVPFGVLPDLGRTRVARLVGVGVPGVEPWRDLVGAVDPGTAVLVAGPDDAVAALVAPGVCRRQALLAPVGEPVAVPCGRCDVCAPLGAGSPS